MMREQEKTREEMIRKANGDRMGRAIKMNDEMLKDAQRIYAGLVSSGNDYAQQVLKMASAMFYPEYMG